MVTLFTKVQDSVVVSTDDPMWVELGERAIEGMFYENYAPAYSKRVVVSGRAARANQICCVCYDRQSGSLRDPEMCIDCAYTAHVEGYL